MNNTLDMVSLTLFTRKSVYRLISRYSRLNYDDINANYVIQTAISMGKIIVEQIQMRLMYVRARSLITILFISVKWWQ